MDLNAIVDEATRPLAENVNEIQLVQRSMLPEFVAESDTSNAIDDWAATLTADIDDAEKISVDQRPKSQAAGA